MLSDCESESESELEGESSRSLSSLSSSGSSVAAAVELRRACRCRALWLPVEVEASAARAAEREVLLRRGEGWALGGSASNAAAARECAGVCGVDCASTKRTNSSGCCAMKRRTRLSAANVSTEL